MRIKTKLTCGILCCSSLLGLLVSNDVAMANTIATKIDSTTARTNPNDVWKGSITFKGKDTVQNGTWEMVLINPFADGKDGYRYKVGEGKWDTRDGKEWVQEIGFKTLPDDYRGYLLKVIVKDDKGNCTFVNDVRQKK